MTASELKEIKRQAKNNMPLGSKTVSELVENVLFLRRAMFFMVGLLVLTALNSLG